MWLVGGRTECWPLYRLPYKSTASQPSAALCSSAQGTCPSAPGGDLPHLRPNVLPNPHSSNETSESKGKVLKCVVTFNLTFRHREIYFLMRGWGYWLIDMMV